MSLQNNSFDELDFSPGVDTVELAPLIFNSSQSAIGVRAFIGHQFNRYIAIEAGIISFGKPDFSLIEVSQDSDGEAESETLFSGDFQTLAGDIRLIGTYPISQRFFLKAYLGIYVWDNETTLLTLGSQGINEQTLSDSGTSLLSGVGVGFGFNDKIALSLDFERSEIASISTQSVGLSILIRFGN